MTRGDDLATLSADLLKAIGEAHARIEIGDVGDELADLLRHARDLHERLLEDLLSSEPALPEAMRGLATSIGNHLDKLDAALRERRD
jgi:flagellar biosynthesis regulator FlaF